MLKSWANVQQHLRRIVEETEDGICYCTARHAIREVDEPSQHTWRYIVNRISSGRSLWHEPIDVLRATPTDKLTYSMDWASDTDHDHDKTDKTPRRFDLGDELYRLEYSIHLSKCYNMSRFRKVLELSLKNAVLAEAQK